MSTMVKKIKFTILNILQTKSSEINPSGAIKAKQVHTPTTQYMLISRDDFLLTILTIKGIFQKGRIIAATSAIFSAIELHLHLCCLFALRHSELSLLLFLLNYNCWKEYPLFFNSWIIPFFPIRCPAPTITK